MSTNSNERARKISAKSNDKGRAFEYACITVLKNKIENERPVAFDEESVMAAHRSWKTQESSAKANLLRAAEAFADTLFSAEPLILECDGEDDVVTLSINKDSDAERGDVRDIVIARKSIGWDVGLSLKHNHFAAKHSRLSGAIDFGKKWYGVPCSQSYWNAVKPIFARLSNLEKSGVAWHEMPDKEDAVYYRLVDAFINEVNRAYGEDRTVPERVISYLLGTRDFYKVVAVDKSQETEFQPFNLRGELNKNGKKSKQGSKSTAEMIFDNDWALSFRIHNASTIVEPSLKFDVQLLGVPANIVTANCRWM